MKISSVLLIAGLASASSVGDSLNNILSYAGDVLASRASPPDKSAQVQSDFASVATMVAENPLVTPVIGGINVMVTANNETAMSSSFADLLDNVGKLLGGFLKSNDTEQLIELMGQISSSTEMDDAAIDQIFAKAQEEVGDQIDGALPDLGSLLSQGSVQAKALGLQGGINQFLAQASILRMGNTSTVDMMQNTKLGLGEVVTLDGQVLLLGPAGEGVVSTIGLANATVSATATHTKNASASASASASGTAANTSSKQNAASSMSPSLGAIAVIAALGLLM